MFVSSFQGSFLSDQEVVCMNTRDLVVNDIFSEVLEQKLSRSPEEEIV